MAHSHRQNLLRILYSQIVQKWQTSVLRLEKSFSYPKCSYADPDLAFHFDVDNPDPHKNRKFRQFVSNIFAKQTHIIL